MRCVIGQDYDEYVTLNKQYLTNYFGGMKFPFHSLRWVSAWWKAFQGEYVIRVLYIYDNTQLLSSVPLAFHSGKHAKMTTRKVEILGSDWGAIDLPEGKELDSWPELLFEYLNGGDSPEWDLLRFGPFYDGDKLVERFAANPRWNKLKIKILEKENIFLDLSAGWDRYMAGRSRNFRRNIKKKEKEIVNDDAFRIARILNPTQTEIESTVFDVSRRSWQADKGVAIASRDMGQEFYNLLTNMEGQFDIDIYLLQHHGRCIAYLLGLIMNGTFHALDTGYNSEYKEISPGFVVHIHAIRTLCKDGIKEFNFGNQHSYKDRFYPEKRDLKELLIYKNKLLSVYDSLVEKASPLLMGYCRKSST